VPGDTAAKERLDEALAAFLLKHRLLFWDDAKIQSASSPMRDDA